MEKTEIIAVSPVRDHQDGRGKSEGSKRTQFEPGYKPPGGRPRGKKNFSTLFYKALERLAEQDGRTVEDWELEFIGAGIKHATAGNASLYNSVSDRVYGSVAQNINQNVRTFERVEYTLADDDLESESENTHVDTESTTQ